MQQGHHADTSRGGCRAVAVEIEALRFWAGTKNPLVSWVAGRTKATTAAEKSRGADFFLVCAGPGLSKVPRLPALLVFSRMVVGFLVARLKGETEYQMWLAL
jgi:hypothetical protein